MLNDLHQTRWYHSEILHYGERKHEYMPHITVCGKGLSPMEAELVLPQAILATKTIAVSMAHSVRELLASSWSTSCLERRGE